MKATDVDILDEWWAYGFAGAWYVIHRPSPNSMTAHPSADLPSGEPSVTAQIAQTSVGQSPVLVVHDLARALSAKDRASLVATLRARFGIGMPVALVFEAHEGQVTADFGAVDGAASERGQAAMAIAVVGASWAWDESPRIMVRTADEHFAVDVLHAGEQWTAAWESAP